jgi:hypothetical protein
VNVVGLRKVPEVALARERAAEEEGARRKALRRS